jgi:NACalpha-BTF3-like transcription factor
VGKRQSRMKNRRRTLPEGRQMQQQQRKTAEKQRKQIQLPFDDVDIGAEGAGVSVNKAKQGVKRPQADSATK